MSRTTELLNSLPSHRVAHHYRHALQSLSYMEKGTFHLNHLLPSTRDVLIHYNNPAAIKRFNQLLADATLLGVKLIEPLEPITL